MNFRFWLSIISLILLILIERRKAVGMIFATQYPQVSALEQGLNSIFTFFFKVETAIQSGNFIKIKFEDFPNINPKQCSLLLNNSQTWEVIECSTLGESIIFIKLSKPLLNNVQHILQIELLDPSEVGSETHSFSIWTVSAQHLDDFFIYDLNTNFCQFPFTKSNSNKSLQVNLLEFGTEQTRNKPNQINSIMFGIEINKQIGDSDLQLARIKVVVSTPWVFLLTSSVTLGNDMRFLTLKSPLYIRPVLLQYVIESPNQISIIFAETFLPGRSFTIQITDLLNPQDHASGTIKVYTLNYNSDIVIEKNENLAILNIYQNPIYVTLLSSLGSNFIGPISLYKGSQQLLRVDFKVDVQVPKNILLKLFYGNNKPIKGSAHISQSASAQDPTIPIHYTYNLTENSLTISNFEQFSIGVTYSVLCRLIFSSVDSHIQVIVRMDDNIWHSSSLFQGQSQQIPLKTNGISILNSIKGSNDLNDGIVSKDVSPSIIISITPQYVSSTSFLAIYASQSLYNPQAECTCNSVTASITQSEFYTLINLESPAGINLFQNDIMIAIQCTGLTAQDTEQYIYEWFMRLYANNQQNSSYVDFTRSTLFQEISNPQFVIQHINDLAHTYDYIFPSFINLVAPTINIFNYNLNDNQVRIISVFCQKGLKSIGNLKSNGDYPCGSNLLNLICEYVEGDNSTDFYLLWDRINIFLPSTSNQMSFHVIFPDFFSAYEQTHTLTTYKYIVSIGIYNIQTRKYQYLYTQPPYVITPKRLIDENLDLIDNLKLNLAGFAGSIIDNVKMTIETRSLGNSGSNYGAAAIIITDWKIWDQELSSSLNVSSQHNGPISFNYTDIRQESHFVTLFPLTNSNLNTISTIILNRIQLPYSYDQPNYNIYLIDSLGGFSGYKKYINYGYNSFYSNQLLYLDFQCNEMQDGIENTYCSFLFIPNNKIPQNSMIQIYFYGFNIYTDTCDLILFQQKINIQSCQINVESNQLIVVIQGNITFPSRVLYKLQIYGIKILQNIQKYVQLSIRDNSGAFIIEQKQKIITTQLPEEQYITIYETYYSNINPYVFSTLYVKFTTPRELYPNEQVAFSMGKDLNDVNTNTDRLNIRLIRSDQTQVNIAVNFVNLIINVIFFNRSEFTAGSYTLKINNIKTPGSNNNDFFKILFIRIFDGALVLTNTRETTSSFLPFEAKINSDIKFIEQRYLQEGALSQLKFQIIMQESRITQNSRIFINFPVYYSPGLTNFQDLLYCQLNNIYVECIRDLAAPYRIKIFNLPISILPKQKFNLTVFGVITPQYSLRFSIQNDKETLFIGIDQGSEYNYYQEYIHLTPPIVERNLSSNYLYLHFANTTTQFAASLSTHLIKIYTDAYIPQSSGILLVFPKEYSTLIITQSVMCKIKVQDNWSQQMNCVVQGRSITIYNYGIPIEAFSFFWIQLDEVPTPPQECIVNYNDMIIQIFDSQYSIIVRNFYNTNMMQPVIFQNLQNVLKVNNNQIIKIVIGTYSEQIYITTPDNTRFITNLQIEASAQGFTFLPSSLMVHIGDFNGSMRIGAQNNMQQKAYSFTINLIEKNFIKFYSIANNYLIFLSSIPSLINISSVFQVPRYGCSLPELIVLKNAPFNDIRILIQYNYKVQPENIFAVDLELSSYSLNYSQSITYRYISFCTKSEIPASLKSLKVQFVLEGTNLNSYQLSNHEALLQIIDKENIEPQIQIKPNNVNRTSFEGSIEINTDGVLYYHLNVGTSAQIMPLNNIKFNIKQQNLIIVPKSDIMSNIQGRKVDERVGLVTYKLNDSSKTITLFNLHPETNYSLCYYFENSFKRTQLIPQCIQFLTKEWQQFSKISIQYKEKIFLDTLNDVLCFFVRELQTTIISVIESQGLSCSFGVESIPYYYAYGGETFCPNSTNIYIIPDITMEMDSAQQLLQSFYDNNNFILPQILNLASEMYGIQYISNSSFEQQFKYSEAIEAKGSMGFPNLKSINFNTSITNYQAQIFIQLTLDKDGAVYFILERTGELLWDNMQEQWMVVPTLINQQPNATQIIQCQNSRSYTVERCIRIVQTNQQSVEANFGNLLYESEYTIYFVVANDYPLYPITEMNINQKQIQIGAKSQNGKTNKFYFYLIIIFLFIFF